MGWIIYFFTFDALRFRNKFDHLCSIFKQNIVILLVSENKIDDTFPVAQFCLEGYSTFILDRTCKGGGIVICKGRYTFKTNWIKICWKWSFWGIFCWTLFEGKKWLLCCCYNPNKNNILFHLYITGKKYDNVILLGNFNTKPEKNFKLRFEHLPFKLPFNTYHSNSFLNTYYLKNIVERKTCFKSPRWPIRIQLVLTNSSISFQDTCNVETGLSEFHKLFFTFL